jgi:redox-sensitive bicupin YhaK (pirin superfamily)
MAATQRSIERLVRAHRQSEGAGFIVRRPFPSPGLQQIDPFLLLDELGPIDYPPGEATGAPDHPHRGFETVTYLLEGESEHQDSAGHRGVMGPGDVQWMTAGDGVVHSEMPSARLQREGGRVHGFQLWVNLPASQKRMKPRYQELPAARLPRATSADGRAKVTILAGEALGQRAVIETVTPITYLDWTLEPGAVVEQAVPAGQQGFAFVFAGEARLGSEARVVKEGDMAILGKTGEVLRLAAEATAEGPARLLLLTGVPLGEPLARYGPFVMNTHQELEEAFEDFRAGRLGRIER